MARAAPRYTEPTVFDVAEATPDVATALRRWAAAQDDAELKADVYAQLRGTPESDAAYVSLDRASKFCRDRWWDVQTTMPRDVNVSYRVGLYLVYVTAKDRSGLSHRWKRVDRRKERALSTAMTFTDHEPMSQAELALVRSNLGPIERLICRLGEVDLSRGKARTSEGRCLWTFDGFRIGIAVLDGGGYIAGVSNTPDPEAPPSGSFPVA